MCKLRVDTILQGPKEVQVDGQDFNAYRFQCEGAVDGEARKFVFETTSTTIRDGIAPLLSDKPVELEATKFPRPDGHVFSVKAGKNAHIKAPRKQASRQPRSAETNRQRALSLAVELERGRCMGGEVPSNEDITKTANYFLQWLEG